MPKNGPSSFGRRLSENDSSLSRSTPTSGPNVIDSTARPIAESDAPRKDLGKNANSEASKGFDARRPVVKLDDIVLPSGTAQAIRRLIACVGNYDRLSQWAPKVFDPERRYMAMNFYGPPGTGKTMCVDAIATELGMPVLEVNYAELESELWGKSSKNIHLAFRRATEQNAILFFDEADSVLGARINNPGHSSDQHLNLSRSVLLKQLDQFSGIVMFATNLERNYDRAFVRRIFQHVEIPLPDLEGRFQLWQKMLTPSIPGYSSLDFTELARASEGLSGGDIGNAVRQALPAVLDRVAHHCTLQTADLLPCIEVIKRSKFRIGTPDANTSRESVPLEIEILKEPNVQ